MTTSFLLDGQACCSLLAHPRTCWQHDTLLIEKLLHCDRSHMSCHIHDEQRVADADSSTKDQVKYGSDVYTLLISTTYRMQQHNTFWSNGPIATVGLCQKLELVHVLLQLLDLSLGP